MTVTHEQFETGLTYEQYKSKMTRNREQLEANERGLQIDPEALEAFRKLAKPLDVLVVCEDWCGDVIANLPVIGRLAADSGKLNLRVFPRDEHPDIMDQYLKDGKYKSIPVFVFFDDNFKELGRFIERPDSVTERRAQLRSDLFAQHPEFGNPDAPIDQLREDVRVQLAEATAGIREQTKPFANSEVIRELRAIVEGQRV